jgi:Lon protease-like protein
MFPLGSVLLPSMVMPLHVFEPRYRALVRRCLDGDRRFGVVLIERGNEVGGGDVRYGVGTRAEVVQAEEMDDGRWLIAVVGVDRVRVVRWLPEDPYPRAEVSPLRGRPPGDDAHERREAIERSLHRVLALRAELGEPSAPSTVGLDPYPDNAAWQAVVLAPLGAFDSQRVLEVVDADERLQLVADLLEDEALLLAQRVAGG